MKNDVILRPDRTRSIGAVYATEIGSYWCVCGGQVVCVISDGSIAHLARVPRAGHRPL